jgi:hypothetical protein
MGLSLYEIGIWMKVEPLVQSSIFFETGIGAPTEVLKVLLETVHFTDVSVTRAHGYVIKIVSSKGINKIVEVVFVSRVSFPCKTFESFFEVVT